MNVDVDVEKRAFRIAYVPVGVPTFHLETANALVSASRELLEGLAARAGVPVEVCAPEGICLSVEAAEAFLDGCLEAGPVELAVFQNATFANGAYMASVLERVGAPVLVWSLRDPAPDGGRLKLNSLTGAYAAGNRLMGAGRGDFFHVLGNPNEAACEEAVAAVLSAALCLARLRGGVIGNVGEPPQGFEFGLMDDAVLRDVFGMAQTRIDLDEMIASAKGCSEADAAPYLEEAAALFPGFGELPEENRFGFAALMKAYEDIAAARGICALASRCWPDYFTRYGTPVCAVLSLMNDRGIPASCEGDTAGALSMLIGQVLSGEAVFFGDPVAVDAEANTITYWHCGAGAPSLASAETGACVGVHCNRRIGPTMNFGCRPAERVTVFRVGQRPGGAVRIFVGEGSAPERPRQYEGTSLVVCWDGDVQAMVHASVEAGWEPHFAVMQGAHAAELEALARMVGADVERY